MLPIYARMGELFASLNEYVVGVSGPLTPFSYAASSCGDADIGVLRDLFCWPQLRKLTSAQIMERLHVMYTCNISIVAHRRAPSSSGQQLRRKIRRGNVKDGLLHRNSSLVPAVNHQRRKVAFPFSHLLGHPSAITLLLKPHRLANDANGLMHHPDSAAIE